MKITYTITEGKCPHCGNTMYKKSTDPGWLILLSVLLLGLPLLWVAARVITRTILKIDFIAPIGDPVEVCSKCGKEVITNNECYWCKLDKKDKKIWSQRVKVRIGYVLLFLAFIFLAFQFIGISWWNSKHSSDRIIIMVFLILLFVCSIGYVIDVLMVSNTLKKKEIYLSPDDFDYIKENIGLYNSRAEEEYVEKCIVISNGTTYKHTTSKQEEETEDDWDEEDWNPNWISEDDKDEDDVDEDEDEEDGTVDPVPENNVEKNDNKKKRDIEALRVLLDEGVITQEEYKKKALEIIDRKD